jgi:hypothetical protein
MNTKKHNIDIYKPNLQATVARIVCSLTVTNVRRLPFMISTLSATRKKHRSNKRNIYIYIVSNKWDIYILVRLLKGIYIYILVRLERNTEVINGIYILVRLFLYKSCLTCLTLLDLITNST